MKLLLMTPILALIACNRPTPLPQTAPVTSTRQTPTTPKTARDFYNELEAANGLQNAAHEYVCFEDDASSQRFFIFGEGKLLREFLEENRKKMSEKDRTMLNNSLIVKFYEKGVPTTGDVEYLTKDGTAEDSWVSGPMPTSGRLLRVNFILNWETLRYKRAAEGKAKGESFYRPMFTTYGRCERIAPTPSK